MKWTKLNAQEYYTKAASTFRMYKLEVPFEALVEQIGEPLYGKGNVEFPEPYPEVEVCWGFVDTNGNVVGIWNYKNGPEYIGEGTLADISVFSVWAPSRGAWIEFCNDNGIILRD